MAGGPELLPVPLEPPHADNDTTVASTNPAKGVHRVFTPPTIVGPHLLRGKFTVTCRNARDRESEYHRKVTELGVDIMGMHATVPIGRKPQSGFSTDEAGAPNSTNSLLHDELLEAIGYPATTRRRL